MTKETMTKEDAAWLARIAEGMRKRGSAPNPPSASEREKRRHAFVLKRTAKKLLEAAELNAKVQEILRELTLNSAV